MDNIDIVLDEFMNEAPNHSAELIADWPAFYHLPEHIIDALIERYKERQL